MLYFCVDEKANLLFNHQWLYIGKLGDFYLFKMNIIYRKKLEILRQHIPVGLQHGLTLLEKVNGDLEQAKKQFQNEMVILVINKTGLSADIAKKHLQNNNYDINITLKNIYEECYSLTERILRRYKDKKEEALVKLVYALEEENELIQNFWLHFEDLSPKTPEIFCLLAIMDWLNYYDFEGLDYAIYFNLDLVTHQIEQQLLLSEIAQTLKIATQIHKKQNMQQKKAFKENKIISHTPEFTEQSRLFEKQRPILINALYEFAKNNASKFP